MLACLDMSMYVSLMASMPVHNHPEVIGPSRFPFFFTDTEAIHITYLTIDWYAPFPGGRDESDGATWNCLEPYCDKPEENHGENRELSKVLLYGIGTESIEEMTAFVWQRKSL